MITLRKAECVPTSIEPFTPGDTTPPPVETTHSSQPEEVTLTPEQEWTRKTFAEIGEIVFGSMISSSEKLAEKKGILTLQKNIKKINNSESSFTVPSIVSVQLLQSKPKPKYVSKYELILQKTEVVGCVTRYDYSAVKRQKA